MILGREGRKSKIKKVNMGIVKQLLRQKEEQNTLLDGTGLHCDLYPKTSGACNFCDYRKKCFHYEWERDYIHKHRSAKESAKLKEKKHEKRIIKDKILKSHLKHYTVYPCEPFDFACPDKHLCNEGRNCPWKQ